MMKSNLQKSDQAFKFFETVEQAKKGIILCIVKAGHALNELHKDNAWKKFNPEAKDFMDFVVNELKISYSTAYNWQRIAENFGKCLSLNAVGTSERKLVALLPIIDEKNKEEWLRKAEVLPDREFYNLLREEKGGKAVEDCDHEEKEKWERCKECKKFLRE